MTVLGVISDTHVPDRVPELDPQVVRTFREASVSAILHAGDVSVPRVLEELGQMAPVYAVRGNRDIFYLRKLPLKIELTIAGVSIGMAHGHGGFARYTLDKMQRAVEGRYAEKYLRRLLTEFPNAEVIVFGHLHVPCSFHLEGKLLFNPGSTSYPYPRNYPGSFGLLHLDQDKEPWGEVIELKKTGK
jgi:putative phosphoesterase